MPRYATKHPLDRFLERVQKADCGCWMWMGTRQPYGHGRFIAAGRTIQAHRYLYEETIGPVPDGLVLDHLCRTPPCVNPFHLEPVTSGENTLRGYGPPAINARMTDCRNGHPLSGDNLYLTPKGYRTCRTCKRDKHKREAKARDAAITNGKCPSCLIFYQVRKDGLLMNHKRVRTDIRCEGSATAPLAIRVGRVYELRNGYVKTATGERARR